MLFVTKIKSNGIYFYHWTFLLIFSVFQNMYWLTYLLMVSCVFVDGYRLPKDVFPEHYKLEVITHLGEKDNFSFEGKVWIQVSDETGNIEFVLKNFDW